MRVCVDSAPVIFLQTALHWIGIEAFCTCMPLLSGSCCPIAACCQLSALIAGCPACLLRAHPWHCIFDLLPSFPARIAGCACVQLVNMHSKLVHNKHSCALLVVRHVCTPMALYHLTCCSPSRPVRRHSWWQCQCASLKASLSHQRL